jgi:hypothetical protein
MKRSIFAVLIALALLTSLETRTPKNVKCCHGCGQYHCKKATVGIAADRGPIAGDAGRTATLGLQ